LARHLKKSRGGLGIRDTTVYIFCSTPAILRGNPMLEHRPSFLSSLIRRGSLAGIIMLGAFLFALRSAPAEDAPAAGAAPASGFRALLDKHQRDALRSIADYVAKNPDAEDAEQASLWMFETALTQGLEADVVGAAEKFLKRPGLDQPSISLAQQALAMGLARSGKRGEALAVFDTFLRGARFQSPFRALDLASSLAAQARIAGDLAASRELYERVSAAYSLNAQIGEIIEGRLARQDLIGQPAPQIGASDMEGKRVEIADLAGKVVLVDFWATNCAPCLAEFPNLRQTYKELHEKGLEIVGVSFDDSPDTVQAFVSRAKLPWRMVMNDSPDGQIAQRYKTRTIPALFLIDRKGTVAQVDIRGNDLRAVIEKLLEK
jgi:peroxiredoxin